MGLLDLKERTRRPAPPPRPAPAGTSAAGPPVAPPSSCDPLGATSSAVDASPRDRTLARLRAAVQAVNRAYPAGLHESLTPLECAALSAAELRLDRTWQAGDFSAAELAVEAWGRLWLDTIKSRRTT